MIKTLRLWLCFGNILCLPIIRSIIRNNITELWKTVSWIAIRFNLLQFRPSAPSFVFAGLFMPSFNVLSGCFQVSLNLRAVSTVWISINFVTQLFLRPLCRGNIWKSTLCFFHLVDGGYTNWTPWTSCSKSCGGGTRVRDRVCTNPPPSNNGQPCSGASYENENCNTQPCPGESPCFKGLHLNNFQFWKCTSFGRNIYQNIDA